MLDALVYKIGIGRHTKLLGNYKTFKELIDEGLTKADAQYRAANIIKHLAKTKHYFNGKLKNK